MKQGDIDVMMQKLCEAISIRNDIETETFKKFIKVKMNQYLHYQASTNVLMNKVKFLDIESKNKDNIILSKNSQIRTLEKDQTSKDKDIRQKELTIKRQYDEITDLKAKIERWNSMSWWQKIFSSI